MEKEKRRNESHLNIRDYQFSTFSYDIVLGILGEYPTDFEDNYAEGFTESVFLKIVTAEKRTSFFGQYFGVDEVDPHLQKYERILKKYYTPYSRQIILDIIFSVVPIEIIEEESGIVAGEIEARAYDYFTQITLDKYKIPRKLLYKLFDGDQVQIISMDDDAGISRDVFYGFYNYIFSKIVSLQPNIYIPQEYELYDLSYATQLLKENDFIANYAGQLNRIRTSLGPGNDAFSQFLIDSFSSIRKKMLGGKIFSECSQCGNFFPYLEPKKYCSPQCRKKAESKRYYQRHKSRLSTLKRKDTAATRKFYKELGIKK